VGRPAAKSSVEILEAAEEVFRDQGYGETSLRQIIKHAGVSPTAFYARFPSREAVLTALVERLLALLYERGSQAIAESTSLEDGFEQAVNVVAATLIEHPTVTRLALTEAAALSEVREKIGATYSLFAELVAAKLTALAEQEKIPPLDATAIAWALVGALQMQILRWAVFGGVPSKGLAKALKSTALALLPSVLNPESPKESPSKRRRK
jgi:AcrR family transcriptional regulator